MKHKQLSFLLAVLMSMVASVASAYDAEVNGIYYNITSTADLTLAVTYQSTSYNSYSNVEGNSLAGMNKVGEDFVVVEQEPTTDYSNKTVQPNLEAITEALGCEPSALGWVALDDTDNFANSNANNGGFWFSAAGTVVAWGSSAFFVEPATNGDYSTLNVGQKPNALSVGDEVSANLYFVNGNNYYTYTVNLKIIQPEYIEYDFKSVAERTFSVKTLVRNAYDCDQTWTMPVENIEAILGTSAPTLYGLTIDSIAEVQGKYSNKYSCDPKPGFWLNTEGAVSVWGDANARVGISYLSDGTFQFFQFPNRNSLGDVFKTQLFLVNEGTNEMITFNISVRFVESLEEKEVVGSEDVVFGIYDDETGYQLDLSRAAEALGVSVEDLVAEENNYLRGLTTSGVYGEHCNCANGLSFDLDGGYNSYGNLYFTIDPDGTLLIACYEDIDEAYDVRAQFCFEVGDKQYVYYARFVSPFIYNGMVPVVTDLVLQDGDGYNTGYDQDLQTLTYTRTFSNTEWQALYVPFEMAYADWQADFEVARLNDVHQWDDNDDGTIDRTELEVVKLKSGKTEANTPYLIRAKSTGEKTITLTNTTLYKAEENSFDVSSWNTKFTFTGTYSGVSGTDMFTNGYYAMGGGRLHQAESSAYDLSPMRWYMTVTDRNGNPKSLGEVKVMVFGDDTDGISPTPALPGEEGEEAVFDLSGRRTDSPTKKGVYIKNGRKVIVR